MAKKIRRFAWNEISNFVDPCFILSMVGALPLPAPSDPSSSSSWTEDSFENRDLQIREMKHQAYSLFREVLSEHPSLAEKAYYNPKEAFIDFFREKRDELDTHLEWSPAERDRREIVFLDSISQDLRGQGPYSLYMKKILGLE